MGIKQISVFLENKSGRLANVTKVLADNNVNIRALSIADTSDFGILRLIVNRPDEAYQMLKKEEFTVSTNEVVAVAVPDQPGGLASILKIFQECGANLEYLYAFIGLDQGMAIMICRVEQKELAEQALQDNNIRILDEEDIYNI